MIELIRTNDPVLLSFLQALCAEARIETLLLDQHTSIVEGSIGAIPRRLMVADKDAAEARRLLALAMETGNGEAGNGEAGNGEAGDEEVGDGGS